MAGPRGVGRGRGVGRSVGRGRVGRLCRLRRLCFRVGRNQRQRLLRGVDFWRRRREVAEGRPRLGVGGDQRRRLVRGVRRCRGRVSSHGFVTGRRRGLVL